MQGGSDDDIHPTNAKQLVQRRAKEVVLFASSLGALLQVKRRSALAIGGMSELRGQRMVLQDIAFNVPNTYSDTLVLNKLFENTCQSLQEVVDVNGVNKTVMSFGPDTYEVPKGFVAGISSFREYGAHATITLLSQTGIRNGSSDAELFQRGNGLQFIKMGSDVLRISKAVEAGASVKYAYGWVDLETPSRIPLEVVVGSTRDPVMLVCLRVGDLDASLRFFTQQLGMQLLPFPLARESGSAFEQKQPAQSVYLGYSADTMGLLLVQAPYFNVYDIKGKQPPPPPVVVGSQIDAFSIVADDTSTELPDQVRDAMRDGVIVNSPDGYPFRIVKYSDYKKKSN